MSSATARNDLLVPESTYVDEDGHRWLHFSLEQPFDYDQVKALPKVVEYEGRVYVRTGWNSDVGRVYYRDGMPVATKAMRDALLNVRAMMDTPVGRRKYASEFERDVINSVLAALKAAWKE